MGNANTDKDRPQATDKTGESNLRGNALTGSEQKSAVDHPEFKKTQNPDTVLRVDDEEDTLYSDGVELEDDTPPMGTAGRADNAR